MKPATHRQPVALSRYAVAFLCLAQTVAVLGEHILFWNGLSLWAYDHLGGVHGVGVALFTITLPALLSYPAGLLVSHLRPRLTLLACGIVRTLLTTTLLLFAYSLSAKVAGPTPVLASSQVSFVVLSVAALTVLVDSFFMPVLKSALPLWAGATPERQGRANALLEATDAPGFVFGPIIATFLYLRSGLSALVFALALSYGTALALLTRLPEPTLTDPLTETAEPPVPPDTLTVPLAFCLTVSAIAMAVLGVIQTVMLPFVRETLHLPESAFGLLVGCVGLGVTLGAGLWTLPPLLRLSLSMRLLLSLSIASGALWLSSFTQSAVVCAAIWFLLGIGFVGITLTLTTAFQNAASPVQRTRILGLAHTLEAAGLLIGDAVASSLVSRLGYRSAFGCGGIVLAALAAIGGGIVWRKNGKPAALPLGEGK